MASRKSEVELCFDSMTDLVTNLAGGLILVVMLLLGLTREAPKASPPPQPVTVVNPKKDDGKPADPLHRRLVALQLDLEQVNGAIDRDAEDLARLNQKVTELLEKAKAKTDPPPPGATPDKK